VRDAHERLRVRIDERRPPAPDPVAQTQRERVRDQIRGEQRHDEPWSPPQDREHETDDEEDEALGADPREVDEQPVQPADAVVDDPALDVSVEADQA